MHLTVPVLKYSSVLNIESATGAKTPSSVPRERLDDSSPRPPSGPRDSSSERRLPQQMNQLKIVDKKFCSVWSSDLSSGKVSPKLLYPLLLARASSITLSSSTVIFLGGLPNELENEIVSTIQSTPTKAQCTDFPMSKTYVHVYFISAAKISKVVERKTFPDVIYGCNVNSQKVVIHT